MVQCHISLNMKYGILIKRIREDPEYAGMSNAQVVQATLKRAAIEKGIDLAQILEVGEQNGSA